MLDYNLHLDYPPFALSSVESKINSKEEFFDCISYANF